jgi:DNA-binding transcriptional MerR regulator
MQLSECARKAGVTPDTVRHYLRIGLIEPEGRNESGYRSFSERTVARLGFIRSATGLGFTLGDIAEMLQMSQNGKLPCPRARVILVERIAQHRERLDAMTSLYKRMQQALRAWQDMSDGVPDGYVVCGLIEGVDSRVPRARPPRTPVPLRDGALTKSSAKKTGRRT